jgi:hypothetical protein
MNTDELKLDPAGVSKSLTRSGRDQRRVVLFQSGFDIRRNSFVAIETLDDVPGTRFGLAH